MRAKLSVVIPTLNAASGLEKSLPGLTEGLQAGVIRELVVSDGGSGDETLQIADAAGAVIVNGAASRGGQLRRGAMASGGDWLLFVHADTVLPSGWVGPVMDHLPSGKPAYFRLRFDRGGLVAHGVAFWANLRSRWLALPYGDQGLLISRDDYETVGGFADIPLMEDVDMARKLGRNLTALPLYVTTNAAKYDRDGWLRRGGRNLILLLRFMLGADPSDLARRY